MRSDKGFNNLLWFMGIVEDNSDPQMLGRCKVRAFGIHPASKIDVPTEDLPWANIITGTYNAAFRPPEINSWVFGFFVDGESCQQPFLVGSMMGMPTTVPSTDTNVGFESIDNGNGQSYPNNPVCQTLYQPDMSPLARGEQLHNTGVAVANAMTGDGSPPSAYGAQYPHNWVHHTRAGHSFELDDTPGNERVNLAHNSGARVEMDRRGNVVIKSPGDNWISVDRNGWVRVAGSWDLETKGSVKIYAQNDMNITVDGNMTTTVHGDYNLNVAGSTNINVGNTIKARASEMTFQASTGSIHLDAGLMIQARADGQLVLESTSDDVDISAPAGAMTLESMGIMSLHSNASEFIAKASGGQMSLEASAHFAAKGSEIHMNSTTAPNAPSAVWPADADLGQTEFPLPPTQKSPLRRTLRSYPMAGAATATDDSDEANQTGPV